MDDKERLIKVEEQTRINTEKIKEHSDLIKELSRTYSLIETMVLRIGNVETNVKNINEKLDKQEEKIQAESVKEIKEKSIKWDKIIDYLFYALLAAALFKLGLK